MGFDTSAAHCAAALVSGGRVLAECREPMTRGQAERLFPLIQDMLARSGHGWSDLTAIGVGVGPGNFTGVRISVAAARGLALSLGIPAVGVTTTEAAALDLPRPCRVVVPLRGDEVLWQDFAAVDAHADRREERHADGRAVAAGPSVAPPHPAGRAGDATGGHGAAGAADPSVAPLHPAGRAGDATGGHGAAGAQRDPGPTGTGAMGAPGGDAGSAPGAPGPAQSRRDDLPPGPPPSLPLWPPAAAIALLAERLAAEGRPLPRPAPVYLRAADAAPPRDAAPPLLP
ncbi:tRNA (adenosine(37)-N6)-threonylcarbamoyltransferase complex dimerization subunit type 1 TsaB [Paracoccus luteus]|uniref:tRNA (adenosine(37)-N6)-threonylcarbamoyltransferase complex dimerization subunit type 1 TsaB n=1 Tax=Paracoccus luteus TaxID=2508543 RepID=UPI00319D9FFB